LLLILAQLLPSIGEHLVEIVLTPSDVGLQASELPLFYTTWSAIMLCSEITVHDVPDSRYVPISAYPRPCSGCCKSLAVWAGGRRTSPLIFLYLKLAVSFECHEQRFSRRIRQLLTSACSSCEHGP
jgi:hypothetical protein